MNPLEVAFPTRERHAQLESTNSRAAQLAQDITIPLPALVVADEQTAGRGRGTNRWWSSAGALTFSLLLDADERVLPTGKWPLVSLAAALAVADVLAVHVPGEVQLKWPNDVYLGGRKVCGILVEAPPVRPARLIVGIGVNVNNSLADAPEEIRTRGTSLLDASGRALDKDQLLEALARQTIGECQSLAAGQWSLLPRWHERCLLSGKRVWMVAGERTLCGHCEGVASDGALVVRTEHALERLYAGVVQAWE